MQFTVSFLAALCCCSCCYVSLCKLERVRHVIASVLATNQIKYVTKFNEKKNGKQCAQWGLVDCHCKQAHSPPSRMLYDSNIVCWCLSEPKSCLYRRLGRARKVAAAAEHRMWSNDAWNFVLWLLLNSICISCWQKGLKAFDMHEARAALVAFKKVVKKTWAVSACN